MQVLHSSRNCFQVSLLFPALCSFLGDTYEPQGHSPCSSGASNLVTAHTLNTHSKEAMDLYLCCVLGREAAGVWGSRQQPGGERDASASNPFHILCHSSREPACCGAWLFNLNWGAGRGPGILQEYPVHWRAALQCARWRSGIIMGL